jgi:hypothetical protein
MPFDAQFNFVQLYQRTFYVSQASHYSKIGFFDSKKGIIAI